MSNEKKVTRASAEKLESLKELHEIAEKQQERINDSQNEREVSQEAGKAEKLEEARQEALEKAAKAEKRERKIAEKDALRAERRRGPISKNEKDAAFNTTMREVQSQMSAPSRTFSKIIHNKAVERTSEAVGNTVARPNAILSGAIFSFVLVLAVYLIARFYGYPLSGSETIAAFALGWVIGLIYDYFRLLVVGKK